MTYEEDSDAGEVLEESGGAWGLVLPIFGFALFLAFGLGMLIRFDFDPQRILDATRGTNPLVFMLLMALLPLLGFPISAFYLFAGAAFPFPVAWLFCIVALAVNMSLAYVLGNYFMRGPIRRWMQGRGSKLPELQKQGHLRLVVVMRAVPGIPFPLQNYVLAFSGCPFPLYLVVSLLVQASIAAGFIAVSTMLVDPETKDIVIVGVIIGLAVLTRLVLVARMWGKRRSE